MPTRILADLPVRDLARSKASCGRLGPSFDAVFSDGNAACTVLGEHGFAMPLVEPFFARFTRKEVAEATKTTEAVVCLGAESRERADGLVGTAPAAGGSPSSGTVGRGPMHGRGFQDPGRPRVGGGAQGRRGAP
ncbi:glyoxalase [Streptomyces sp. ME03-5709C]|nr:glyoxalase [Streptomyces sp. ME03-5709C]